MNRNIRHIGLLPLLLLFIGFSSCQDKEWDNHYNQDGGAVLNLMQLLESNSNYSSFCKVVKEQHLDSLLSSDQTFTVWAPDNDAMASFNMSADITAHFLKNHINRYVYNAADLVDTSMVRIKMLNGKFQNFQHTSSGYSFAGITLTDEEGLATNGLIHRVSQIVPFYLNVYENVKQTGNQTDSLAKYLKGLDVYEFNKSKSTAVGKNSLGQLVYDSVFNYSNQWMRTYGDLYKEDSVYTVLVPTNTGWNTGYAAVSSYFKTFGKCETSSVSNISISTRKYTLDDALADSLTHAYTVQNMASNIVFRGIVNPLTADGDSLVATSGNVFHHPADLFSGTTEEVVSNGKIWKMNTWNFKPADCFYKPIVVEAENTLNRTDAYANVFSRSAANTTYADSVSGMKYIEVNAATTSARTQPMVQFTIPNTLAAEYDIYCVFAPAEAYTKDATADSTRVGYYLNYVHADGRMYEDKVIAGSITHGSGMTYMYVGRFKFPFANYSGSEFTGNETQDADCVKLRVQTTVSSSETTRLSRTMRIDRIIFKPVTE